MINKSYYTRNFSIAEFASKDGGVPLLRMDPILMDRAQVLRDMWGHPVHINSGIRSVEHNRAVGGKEASRHLRGLAMDVSISHLSDADRYAFIELCFRQQFEGIGISKAFIHLDVGRVTKKAWVY